MVQTLWDTITEFLAGGDRRTEALQEGIRENVTPFVPPNLREPLGLLAEVNPVQDIYRAGGNMRGGNYVDAGIDTAIAAAPVVGGVLGRVGANQLADTGGDAARAAMDTLLGGAPGRSASAVDTFADRMNQRGPVPTMYSNPLRRDIEDYAGVHRAPGRNPDNASLDDLTNLFPDDIYDRSVAAQYYGHMEDPVADQEMIDLFARMRGNPDAKIPVYRAVPSNVDAGVNPGDWVTPSRRYAVGHGEGPLGGDYKIVETEARAGDLFTDANSIFEFGYDPAPSLPASNNGIRAYHGSPHDFDRFSMDAIGTGEGAQAYGHGLYFAEKPEIAQFYRDNYAKPDPNLFSTDSARQIAQDQLQAWAGDIDGGLNDLRASLRNMENTAKFFKPDTEELARMKDLQEAISYIEQGAPRGRMYEVNINANPDDFLDWDAPLSEQPEALRNLVQYSDLSHLPEGSRLRRTIEAYRRKPGDWVPEPGISIPEPIGNDIHSALTDFGTDSARNAAMTRAMSDAGIPGIKYRDAGSRGMDGAEGTRNFVVFDENLIEIVRKYGIAGAAAMLGMSQADVAQAMGQNVSGGLLATQDTEQQREEEIRQYLGGLL